MRLYRYLFLAMLMVTSCVTPQTSSRDFYGIEVDNKAFDGVFAGYPDGRITVCKLHSPPSGDESRHQHVEEHVYGVVILNSAIRRWHILWDCRGWLVRTDILHYWGQNTGLYGVYDITQDSMEFSDRGWMDGYPLKAVTKRGGGFVDVPSFFEEFPHCQFVYVGRPGKGLMFWRRNEMGPCRQIAAALIKARDVVMITTDWGSLYRKMAMLEEQYSVHPK